MAYDIPNESQAAHGEQATLFSTDVDALIQGFNREGVISGCAVTAQAPPAMAVDVALGVGHIGGSDVNVAAGSVNITAADATRMRIDIIVVNNAGAKSAVDGTWDATDNPLMPAIPANSILLAAIYVPAATTTITSDEIIDKRVFLGTFQEGDVPAAIMRDAEHTAIGDGAPHHTKYTDGEADARVAVGIATHEGVSDPHAGYQKESEKDAANGYCGLDGGVLVPLARIPATLTGKDADTVDGIEGAALMTEAEHTALGDGAPHHAAATAGADAQHSFAGQVLSGTDAAAAQKGHIQLAGDLGGAAAAPTVNATHSGSPHHVALTLGDAMHSLAGQVLSGVDAAAGQKGHIQLAGQLGGTAALPDVRGLRETGGPTLLTLGAIADGEFLKRVGATVVGAAAGGGATDHLQDADDDTEWHVEKNADEDKIRGKVAGTERFVLQNTTPHLTLTGDLRVDGWQGIKAAPAANQCLTLSPVVTGWAAASIYMIRALPEGIVPANQNLFALALTGIPSVAAATVTPEMVGVTSAIVPTVHGTITKLSGVEAIVHSLGGAGAITAANNFNAYSMGLGWMGPKPSTYNLFNAEVDLGNAAIGLLHGLRIVDQTAITAHLLELGPANPYLRVVGGGDAPAFQTNVWMKEAANLRQVRWMDPGAGGANFAGGERVMVLV